MSDSGPLYWTLRLACAAEFVGHGAFGIITKAAWLPYFGVVGIPPEWGWRLMPMIGTVDITLGLLVGLILPARGLLLYMAFWGFLPAAGEPWWEFIERACNMVAPFALWYVMRYAEVLRRNDSFSLGQHFKQSEQPRPGPGRPSAGG